MTLTNYLKYGLVVAFLLLASYLMGIQSLIAKAAGVAFRTDCVTAAATSTLKYQTPGTATSTVTCAMGPDGANSALLAIQVNASSTATRFNVFVEESMDGQDYYPITETQVASTTNPFEIGIRGFAAFTFASSTNGGDVAGTVANGVGVNGTQNRNTYSLDIPVRMKFVRAYMATATTSLPGSGNAGVWMQIIPRIQI